MNHKENPGASASDIAAARLLLQKMGIDPADSLQDPAGTSEIPTFADYIPRVSQAVSDGTRRVYSTYWNRVVEAWGPETHHLGVPSREGPAHKHEGPRAHHPRVRQNGGDGAQRPRRQRAAAVRVPSRVRRRRARHPCVVQGPVIRATLCPASRCANIHRTTGAVTGSGSSLCARRPHAAWALFGCGPASASRYPYGGRPPR